jgi:hypothetical protein
MAGAKGEPFTSVKPPEGTRPEGQASDRSRTAIGDVAKALIEPSSEDADPR